jgi:hypothetical protein
MGMFSRMQYMRYLPIKFYTSVSAEKVESVLQNALVQWHLTGVELTPGQDPASEEHFGISIVEGNTSLMHQVENKYLMHVHLHSHFELPLP